MNAEQFVARMVADIAAAEPLPETMVFVVPPWWLDHPDLLDCLVGMAAMGTQVAVQANLRLPTVPLNDWLRGVRAGALRGRYRKGTANK